jgi:hypothetical protein
MAKGAIFIGWGETPAGYRQKAVKVFDESLQFWKRMQQKGDIESFEPVFLDYHGGDLGGFILVKGDREKLSRLRMSPEFERIHARASIIVKNLGIIDAFVGEELQRRLADFAKESSELD